MNRCINIQKMVQRSILSKCKKQTVRSVLLLVDNAPWKFYGVFERKCHHYVLPVELYVQAGNIFAIWGSLHNKLTSHVIYILRNL